MFNILTIEPKFIGGVIFVKFFKRTLIETVSIIIAHENSGISALLPVIGKQIIINNINLIVTIEITICCQ